MIFACSRDMLRQKAAMSWRVTTDVKRGDGLLMSCSLASRTAAMIDAAITGVEANQSSLVSALPSTSPVPVKTKA
jgi:hypothetical protein